MVNICKKFLKKEEVDDIIIFGSLVKGKRKVEDFDVCFVLNKGNGLIEEALADFEKNGLNVHITKTKFCYLTKDPVLWRTLIHEGFSVKKNKNMSEILGIKPFFLFEYDLKKLDKIKKQGFSHALYGTGGRVDFLKTINGSRIGKNAVIIPIEKSEEMRSFLETWNVLYKVRRIWL